MEVKFLESIKIALSRYEELLLTEQKYKQYKKFLLDNTNNNSITKIMTTIENKSLIELLKEEQQEEKIP